MMPMCNSYFLLPALGILGFVYGAKKGKILNMFIDDLSLPQKDQCGAQEVNEVCKTVLFSLENN